MERGYEMCYVCCQLFLGGTNDYGLLLDSKVLLFSKIGESSNSITSKKGFEKIYYSIRFLWQNFW